MLKITMTKIFLCLFLCLPALAQATEETPEAVAKAYIAASTASDWSKATSYLDPEALVSFKRMFGEIMKLDKKNEAGKELFGLKNNAEFEQLSGEQVFTKIMEILLASVPQLKQMLSGAQNTIIGQVAEGSDIVHIVYRMNLKIENAPISKVEVMTLKKVGSSWRLQLSGEMEGAITAMAQAMAEEAQEDSAKKPAAPKKTVRKQ